MRSTTLTTTFKPTRPIKFSKKYTFTLFYTNSSLIDEGIQKLVVKTKVLNNTTVQGCLVEIKR